MQGSGMAIAAGECARVQRPAAAREIHALRGERTVCGETNGGAPPAVKMPAAMMPAAEMVAVTMTATTMAAAMMTAATTTAVATTMTTFRDRKVRHGQHRCEDNRGNSQCDL